MHILNLNFFLQFFCHLVANRFASDYGMMRLSIGEAVRFVLTQQPKTELAKLINAQIRKGIPLPDELAIRALEVNLLDTRSSTRGWVEGGREDREGLKLVVVVVNDMDDVDIDSHVIKNDDGKGNHNHMMIMILAIMVNG